MSTLSHRRATLLDWTALHHPSARSLRGGTSSFRMAPVTQNTHSEKLLPSTARRCRARTTFLTSTALSKTFHRQGRAPMIISKPYRDGKSQSPSERYGSTFLRRHRLYTHSMCQCQTYHRLKENATFPLQRANHIIY